MSIPILTIDGPSGSGKGTVAARVAKHLGWHVLDSGALYRLSALAVQEAGLDLSDEAAIAERIRHLSVAFKNGQALLNGRDVSAIIRSESIGNLASKIAALPKVREALLDWQRAYVKPPGLVADGRDMGSVVFPEAQTKIFLDASAEERARRRYKQLMDKGIHANLSSLIAEIQERDQRDRNRRIAPLRPAPGALVIDSTQLSIEEVVQRVLSAVQQSLG